MPACSKTRRASSSSGRPRSECRPLSSTALCALAAASLTAGCAVFQPYVEPGVPRPGLTRDASGGVLLSDQQQLQPIHVSVEVAREYARLLEDAYRQAATDHSTFRRVIDSSLIATAATAVGLATTGGGTEAAGLVGLSGGALSLWGSRMQQAVQRTIYLQGARALECVIGAANRNLEADHGALELEAKLAFLREGLQRLERNRGTYSDRLREEVRAGRITNSAVADQATQAAIRLESLARITLRFGHRVLDVRYPLGQVLLSKVEEVRILVDYEIAKSEPDLLNFDSALKESMTRPMGVFGEGPVSSSTESGGETGPEKLSASAGTTSPEFQVAAANLEITVAEVARRREDVLNTVSQLAERPRPSTNTLFSDCSLVEIGQRPLRIEPAVVQVAKGSAAYLVATVSGGSGRYKRVERPLPSGVEPTLNGSQLTVKLTKGASGALATSPVVLVIEDIATGNERTFSVQTDTAAATTPTAPAALPAAACSDEDVKKIQTYLLTESINGQPIVLGSGGPSGDGVDCVFGTRTREAVVAYLKENLADLRAAHPNDAEVQQLQAAGVDSLPDDKLTPYMLSLI